MFKMLLSAGIDYSKPIEDVGQKLMFGGEMVLLGMGAVFSVLFIIFLSLTLFKFAFAKNGSSKPKKAEIAPTPVTPAAPVTSTDEEIVAVIAAAIAMAEAESSGTKFRVVSFRRV